MEKKTMESKEKIEAICLKTYPDEDDMEKYVNGELAPCDVKIYYKGKKYKVSPYFDEEYYKAIDESTLTNK